MGKADERVTLLIMYNLVQPTDRVLYIHSKGVSDARCAPYATCGQGRRLVWFRVPLTATSYAGQHMANLE